MQAKNIIVVNSIISNGGAERVMAELMNEWHRCGHNVTFVSWLADAYPVDEYVLDDGIRRIDIKHKIKKGKIRQLLCIKEMISLLKKENDATVIAMIRPSMMIAAVSSLFSDCRVIFSERADPKSTPVNPIARALRIVYFNLADVCVFQTEEAKSFFSQRIQKKGITIPNPINPALPAMFQGERRKVVVSACRLVPEKNIPMLLKAFKMFAEEFPEFTLEIYGSAAREEESNIRACIEQLGLESKAKLMGFTSNLYERMRDCAMYVSSSNVEGISNSLMEALGMGLPVIATDCPAGGSRMLIQNGENGLLIPMEDVEALYEGMIKIATDPQFAEKLSRNAYDVRETYKVEAIAAKWLEII